MKLIKGKKLASFPEVVIYEGFPYSFYEVKKPKFNEKEQKLANALTRFLARISSLGELESQTKGIGKGLVKPFKDKIVAEVENQGLMDKLPEPKDYLAVKNELTELIKKNTSFKKDSNNLATYVLDHSIGYGPFAPLMRDPHLEEIMLNGYDKNLFVLHKEYGMCRTDIMVEKNDRFIVSLLNRIARQAQRKFDLSSPLLDARLPDGSRANATYPSVTPFGPSLTIRKFTYIPLSIVDLIANGTMSSELAGFLWVMGEGMNIEPKNIICTGGTSSGKTTTLNALSTFINYRDRIVTIEDTLELDLGGRENWVQMEAKPKTKETPQITMDELLQNALRMRPDRLVVGEVRGPEAHTMFVAMDTGHAGCLGTLHANTAREMMVRLKSPPMNVPEQMLPLLDLILVHYRMYHREKGLIRRIAQVAEVARMNEKVLLSNIFEWSPKTDQVKRTDMPSHALEDLSGKTGLSKKALQKEIMVRQRILEWMLENNIKSTPDVEKIIQEYYFDPNAILEKVSKFSESGK
jgi:flagellar protein FlaI